MKLRLNSIKHHVFNLLIVSLLLGFGALKAGDRKVLKEAAGKYRGNLGGSYTTDATGFGGAVTTSPLLGDDALLRLPRGTGKGKARIDIPGVPLDYQFRITRVKVRASGITYQGSGVINDSNSGLAVVGTIRAVSKKTTSGRKVTSVSRLTGTLGPVPIEVEATINGEQE